MIENIHNNQQVLQQIEWLSITNILKKHSHFDVTLQNILTELNSNELKEKYQIAQGFRANLALNDHQSFIKELKSLDTTAVFLSILNSIEKYQARSICDINELALCTELYLNHYFSFVGLNLSDQSKEEFHIFKQKFKKFFLKEFRHFVKTNGEISFESHPKLKPLYLKQISIEQKIRAQLSQIVNQDDISKRLQFNSYDLINDHYIIPVKSDSYQSHLGQIISRSDSGHTLYIEPKQISLLNHQRLEILIQVQEIIAKIELELIKNLSMFLPELITITSNILTLDELLTRQSFSDALDLNTPIIVSEMTINVEGFFHPLISNPVRNDFKLTENKAGFIISGPNTGGKTATLKSMAIIQVFLKYGLDLPCRSARIFPYQNIYYFGNDQQMLEEGLSSFSAEVSNYIQLLDQINNSNLILIDEIFNSTSSEEASALAMAIFKYLKSISQCHIIVSSHHQTLKTIIHQDNDYISAHVGFDQDLNKPTYKIHIGAPGSSYALNIFKAMTIDKSNFSNMFDVATKYLDNKAIHYEKLLESISKKDNELNKLLLENQDINKQLKNQKDSMQGIIKLKIDEKITQANQSLDNLLGQGKNLLAEVKNKNITKENKLHHKITDLKKKAKDHSPFNEEAHNKELQPNLFDPEEYVEGEYYFCLLVNKTVLLKKLYLKKQEAQVSVGNMNLKSPLKKLKIANKKPSLSKQNISIHVDRNINSKLEYDCRGMRLSEFEDLIQKHITDVLIGDIPFLNIIHGHGDGILKGWLKKFIIKHKDLTFDQSKDGNSGSSRIILN